MARDVKAYLNRQKKESPTPEIAQLWANLERLHNTRLWHQLTGCLRDFVTNEIFQNGGLVELYHNFIGDFEMKLNPLSLMEIILIVVAQIADPNETIAFLESMHEKVQHDIQAKILCKTAVGRVKLGCGLMEEVRLLLEETREVLDSIDGVTTVHARFYDLSSHYHQIKADHSSYYRDALRYLGCMDIEDIPLSDQVTKAFSLSLAALLGEDVYNFGELLAHPVLDSLRGTEKQWLVDVLFAFNAGDITMFESLRSYWETQPDLSASLEQLMKKIRILSLMELVFKRQAHDRTIKFSTVSETTQIPLDQVEHLAMKTLATGLVKGTIDEVNQEITLPWVQPRVLDLTQVGNLHSRMESWCKVIQSTIHVVKDEVPDIVVS